MTILSTLRQQQQRRVRTVLSLLVLVWLNVALQACASAAPATELSVDRPVEAEVQHLPSDHSGHVSDHDCAQCLDCEHDGCTESSVCDGSVVVSTKAETRLLDNLDPNLTAFAPPGHSVAAPVMPCSSSERGVWTVVASGIPLNVQHCVYLI